MMGGFIFFGFPINTGGTRTIQESVKAPKIKGIAITSCEGNINDMGIPDECTNTTLTHKKHDGSTRNQRR